MPNRNGVLGCVLFSLCTVLNPLSLLSIPGPTLSQFWPGGGSSLAQRANANLLPPQVGPDGAFDLASFPSPVPPAWPTSTIESPSYAPFSDIPTPSVPISTATGVPERTPSRPSPPLLARNQMVVFYGAPGQPTMGVLGRFSPDEAGRRVRQQAEYYDTLNGDRGAVPAMDVIYAMAQSEATSNGLYLRYLSDRIVREYIRSAEQHDTQLILDLQIGRGNVLDEVRKIEPYLTNPRVHVAIDPEYAVGPDGVPIETPGIMSGGEIQQVLQYLSDLVQRNNLPPKILILHQYLEGTIVNGDRVHPTDGAGLVVNMDGYGADREKRAKYREFSARPYAQRRGFNIFLRQDEHVLSAQEALALSPPPDVIFYQ